MTAGNGIWERNYIIVTAIIECYLLLNCTGTACQPCTLFNPFEKDKWEGPRLSRPRSGVRSILLHPAAAAVPSCSCAWARELGRICQRFASVALGNDWDMPPKTNNKSKLQQCQVTERQLKPLPCLMQATPANHRNAQDINTRAHGASQETLVASRITCYIEATHSSCGSWLCVPVMGPHQRAVIPPPVLGEQPPQSGEIPPKKIKAPPPPHPKKKWATPPKWGKK